MLIRSLQWGVSREGFGLQLRRYLPIDFTLIRVILLAGALLRALNLSHGQSFHPDERHIVMTVTGLSWENLNPKTFAYGSFPFYLMFFVGRALTLIWEGASSYDGMFLVGRGISVAFGVLGVWLTYLLGVALTGRRGVGLIAAGLLAVNPFHIQLSRYATVDGLLTTLGLLALLGAVRLVRGYGNGRALWLMAIGLGLSLSTKISSLSLLLPLGLALCLSFEGWKCWRSRSFWASAVFVGLVAGLLSFITQPYAVLDVETFRHHTTEQVNMVRGLWRPPYTVQYEGTTPYLYHLEQMFHYTLGAPVFLALLAGMLAGASALVRAGIFRGLDGRWLIVGGWMLAVFLIVGRYQVKFPRYLLPLYPVLMVVAGAGLMFLHDWIRARAPSLRDDPQRAQVSWAFLPAGAVLLLAALSGIAFVQIYKEPHVYETASRWIYEHVPRQSRLLGVHWDDKLPLSLPGLSSREYGFRYETVSDELPVYEPDSPEKLALMARRMADTDFIVLPTARTYGSLLRVPEEFPLTTRMFKLLFSGELGFQLQASFKVRPALLGRTLNNDLADESITVYDHPKVLIFRNQSRLVASEIEARVNGVGTGGGELPSRDEIMLAEAGTSVLKAERGPAGWAEQLRATLVWYLAIQVLSFAILPVLALAFPRAPDGALAFSKVLGLPLWGLGLWLAGTLLGLPLESSVIAVVSALLLLLVVQGLYLRKERVYAYLRIHSGAAWFTEGLFLGACLLFLAARAVNPEIFWGEKPMDLTFLNFFSRVSALPPDDPWFYRPGDGQGMSYYYLGFFYFGQLLKLAGISGGVGYNLGLATVGALAVVAACGTLWWMIGSRWWALLGAVLLVCVSNSDVMYLWLIEGRTANFDLFWASSRMMTSPSITEYPLWSLLFADFHPHVMALPVTIALVGLSVGPLLGLTAGTRSILAAVLVSLVWGMLLGLNSWDAIVAGLLVAAAALVWLGAILSREGKDSPAVAYWVLAGLGFGMVAFWLVGAFSSSSHAGVKVQWGYVYPNEFNTIGQLMRHLGIWLIPIALSAGALLWGVPSLRRVRALGMAGALAAVIVGAACGLSLLAGVTELPWGIVGIAGLLMFFGALFLIGAMRADDSRPFSYGLAEQDQRVVMVIGLLLEFSGLIILGAELFFLMDRMNTIFKFYLPLWTFLVLAMVLLVWLVCVRRLAGSLARRVVGAVTASLVLVGFGGSILNAAIMLPYSRMDGPKPTLDGTAYLERLDGDEARLIRFLNASVQGIQPVIEAWGNSYAEFTRIAMHTGLPTVLGWEHHVYQRGAPRLEIEERKRDIRELYTTRDAERVRAIAEEYGVELIVVGNVERRLYQQMRGAVFMDPEGHGFEVLAEYGPVSLLRVR